MKFTDVYSQFLNTLRSNTLAELSDEDIIAYLDELMIRAIADFSFPYVSLEYTTVSDQYEFVRDVSQREINVLIVMIKSYWLEQQLDDDGLFGIVYFDRDVKTESTGSKLRSMESRYELSKQEIKRALHHYYSNNNGVAEIGNIYE